MIEIAPPEIRPTRKSSLALTVHIQYDGSAGYPLTLHAQASSRGTALATVQAPPLALAGPGAIAGPLTLTLQFVAPDPDAPRYVNSDGIDLQVTGPAGDLLAGVHADYIRQWARDVPALRPRDLEGLPYAAAALGGDALRAAFDGDEGGGLVIARPRGGGLVGLVVGLDAAAPALPILRWFDYSGPAAATGERPAGPAYAVPPSAFVDLAAGRVVATPDAADAVWEPEAGPGSPLHLRPLNGATLAALRTPIMLPLAATRVFARGNPHEGTGRDWPEIRDLFDNCDEEPYRAGFCVDNVWAPAGIEFRVIVRRDIRIQDNWAQQLPATGLREFSRDHNLPQLLNVYFFRSVEGARAWGAADRDPGTPGQLGALWIGDRCPGNPTPHCWQEDVITVAHEAGHFLSLVHRCDDTQGHVPCRPGDDLYLMYGDGTDPQSLLLTDGEIFQARQRAWYYRP